MDMNMYFTAMILLFCTIDLAMVLGDRIRYLVSRPANRDRTAQETLPRNDWYVFFHCRALTGSAAIGEASSQNVDHRVQQTEPAKGARRASSPRARL